VRLLEPPTISFTAGDRTLGIPPELFYLAENFGFLVCHDRASKTIAQSQIEV